MVLNSSVSNDYHNVGAVNLMLFEVDDGRKVEVYLTIYVLREVVVNNFVNGINTEGVHDGYELQDRINSITVVEQLA